MSDYLSKMLYALTSAYTRKDYDNRQRGSLLLETNIGKLLSLFAWGLDSVQEQAELVKEWDDIDKAEGAVLDRYGANFGVKRESSNDRIYRITIKVKMLAELSGGDIDTIIEAASSLLDVDVTDVLLEEVFPAKIKLYVDRDKLSDEIQELIYPIANAIKRLMAAGVGLRLYERTYHISRLEIPLAQFAIVNTHLKAPPVSKDREGLIDYQLNYGGFVYKHQWSIPYSGDKNFTMPIQIAQGAFQTNSSIDAQKSSVGCQSCIGRTMYHTHIKAKRID